MNLYDSRNTVTDLWNLKFGKTGSFRRTKETLCTQWSMRTKRGTSWEGLSKSKQWYLQNRPDLVEELDQLARGLESASAPNLTQPAGSSQKRKSNVGEQRREPILVNQIESLHTSNQVHLSFGTELEIEQAGSITPERPRHQQPSGPRTASGIRAGQIAPATPPPTVQGPHPLPYTFPSQAYDFSTREGLVQYRNDRAREPYPLVTPEQAHPGLSTLLYRVSDPRDTHIRNLQNTHGFPSGWIDDPHIRIPAAPPSTSELHFLWVKV